jgi:Protein of unknown function (DUF3987)
MESTSLLNEMRADIDGLINLAQSAIHRSATERIAIAESHLRDKTINIDLNIAMPPEIQNYMDAICESTGAHPILVLSSILATCSAFLGKFVYMPKGDYFQNLHTNLWFLTVAESGQFKTTGLNQGAAVNLNRQDIINKKIDAYKLELSKTKEIEHQAFISRKILDLSRLNFVLPNKMTGEALLDHLAMGHTGVIYHSELAIWLKSLDKSFNNDLKGIITDLYDVPSTFRYKTKHSGDNILTTPCFSICGVSTLDWLKDNINKTDVMSGFFARFIMFVPPINKDMPKPLPIDDHGKLRSIETIFEAKLGVIVKSVDKERKMGLSTEGKDCFKELHENIYKRVEQFPEDCRKQLEPYCKRWSPQILKIAMLLQLFQDPDAVEVGVVALNQASSIINYAIMSTALLSDGELYETEFQGKCGTLFKWMCRKTIQTGDAIKYSDILKSKLLDGKEYDIVLDTLINSALLSNCQYNHKKKDQVYELLPKQL